MKKLSLKEFIRSADLEYIEDPELIMSIINKMWKIPFEEMFHAKWRYKDPTPWGYIYEEFADQEQLVPNDADIFSTLQYGEIVLILQEEITRRKSEAEADGTVLDILIVFGRIYKYFIW